MIIEVDSAAFHVLFKQQLLSELNETGIFLGGAGLGGAGKGDGKTKKDKNKSKNQQEVPVEESLPEDKSIQNPENDDQDSIDINRWIIIDHMDYSIAYSDTIRPESLLRNSF